MSETNDKSNQNTKDRKIRYSKAMYDDLLDHPLPDVPLILPKYPPHHQDVIVGYQLVYNDWCSCVSPKPRRMNLFGWLAVLGLSITCLPLFPIPCCLSGSYNMVQRPVYGPANLFLGRDIIQPHSVINHNWEKSQQKLNE